MRIAASAFAFCKFSHAVILASSLCNLNITIRLGGNFFYTSRDCMIDKTGFCCQTELFPRQNPGIPVQGCSVDNWFYKS